MTYGVGLLLKDGFVLAADTRTNAGVDHIATFKKLHSWQMPGQCVFALATSGNLATTQSVVSLLTEAMDPEKNKEDVESLFEAKSMLEENFGANFLFAGQIGSERPRLFEVYSAGNFIEATSDTPYLQIGEHKYGKPILDRVTDMDMRLGSAAKLILLSFDSTLRSNLSVGMPIDLIVYTKDSLKFDRQMRIQRDNPYFQMLSGEWSKALRKAFAAIEEFDI
jgi:putative proteasome-type protease